MISMNNSTTLGIKICRVLQRNDQLNSEQITKQIPGGNFNAVAKACQKLRSAGILENERGRAGGYTLNRPWLSVLDIVDAMGGVNIESPAITRCVRLALKGLQVAHIQTNE